MTIPAQRFTFMDKETQVAIAEPSTVDGMMTNNAVPKLPETMSPAVEDFLSTTKPPDTPTTPAATVTPSAPVSTPTPVVAPRAPVDTIVETLPVANPTSPPTAALKDIIGDAAGATLAKQSLVVSKDIVSVGTVGKESPDTFTKDMASFSSLIDKVSIPGFTAPGSANKLNASGLVGLTTAGYDLGLSGVFPALSGNVDSGVLNKSSAAVMSLLNKKSDSGGFLDMISSTLDLDPLAIMPGLVEQAVGSFIPGKDVKEQDLGGLNTLVETAFDNLNPAWKSSEVDGIPSTKGVLSKELSDTYTAGVLDNMFGENSLDLVPSSYKTFLMASF